MLFEMALGSPSAALAHFAFFTVIGIALGMILYALFAWPGTRRGQFRSLDAMPRLGAVIGVATAVFFMGASWQNVYLDFYRIEIDAGEVRLHYEMPPRTVALPLSAVDGMRKRILPGRRIKRQIVVETSEGSYVSARLRRDTLESAWQSLSDCIKPLE